MRWCGEGTVALASVTLTPVGEASGSRWELDPTLPPLRHGEVRTQRIHGPAVPQVLSITVVARDDHGRELVVSATTEAVPDPAFVAAEDACTARGGSFHPVGLAQNFACDAPTHDAGRRCSSSDECEGPCIFDHAEVATTSPDGRTCAAGEELRVHVGACSARSILFGCHARLTEVTTECVRPGALMGRRVVCSD